MVPEHARKQTKLPKTAPDAQNGEQASPAPESGHVRLDLLAKASGFSGTKEDRELEQFMSALRLSTTEGMIQVADSKDDEDEDQDDEDEDEGDDCQDGSDGGDDGDQDNEHDPAESKEDRKARKAAAAANGPKISRGAARKAALDGDDSKIAQLVASDRAKAARRAEKHHGRKAHAGKGGRAHAGGKAKTGKARMVSDSLDF